MRFIAVIVDMIGLLVASGAFFISPSAPVKLALVATGAIMFIVATVQFFASGAHEREAAAMRH